MKVLMKIIAAATCCAIMLAGCAGTQTGIASSTDVSSAALSDASKAESAATSTETARSQAESYPVSSSDIASMLDSSMGVFSSVAASSSAASSSAASSSAASSSAASSSAASSSAASSSAQKPFVKPGETIRINGAEYTRTFYDDFEGTALDTSKWSLCPQQTRQDIGGKWSNDCTSLDGNGNLVLTAKKDGNTYKSGAIRSKDKFEQAQGYFECRAKLQTAPGFWGAFWLLSDSMSSWFVKDNNTATDGIEIDIMESCNVYSKAISTALHWDGYGSYHNKLGKEHYPTDCYDGEFHTFSFLWTDTAYVWYIDGTEIYRTQKGWGNYPGCCEDACYLKVTTEFGSWAAAPVDSKLPDKFVVDYVMAYQKAS